MVHDNNNEYNVYLIDDGTMDTVIKVNHERWAEPRVYRYTDTSDYRDESGSLDFDTFIADVVIPDAELEE